MKKELRYQVNERIQPSQVLVISTQGENLGVLDRRTAIGKARAVGLDLILVAPQAKVPVARIANFRKFLYERHRELREARRGQRDIKELRLGANTDKHDLDVRIERAKEFLKERRRIKFLVNFKGRQIVHKKIGQEKLSIIVEALKDLIEVERQPWFEGRRLMMIVRPK